MLAALFRELHRDGGGRLWGLEGIVEIFCARLGGKKTGKERCDEWHQMVGR